MEKSDKILFGMFKGSTWDEILSSPVTKQVARTATQVLTRTLLGALGVSSSSRKKKSSWF
jgi:hypothetical protein